MASQYYYGNTHADYARQEWNDPYTVQRAQAERIERPVADADVVPGRIMWLPSREELPERAVRRAHGKGAVEDGIYQHPVVVVARLAHVVHFQLITSLQGKKLHQLYPKSNEFHASRRSWYLPISPTLDHPDAVSKKSKKRYPTLDLAAGATLRWDSYVNIRHVYKTEWSCLKAYTNTDTPSTWDFCFDRESMIRMLAKTKTLTGYEPGITRPQRSYSMPMASNGGVDDDVYYEADGVEEESAMSRQRPSSTASIDAFRSSFHTPRSYNWGIARPLLDKPPDDISGQSVLSITRCLMRGYLDEEMVANDQRCF